MRKIDLIVLHCSASNLKCQSASMIDRWHKKRGFKKIGYHYFIGFEGMIEVGRDEDEAGAHVKGYNEYSIGICLAGRSPKSFTYIQFRALSELLKTLKLRYPEASLIGHREINRHKECPVFNYKHFVSVWNKRRIKWNILPMLSRLLKRFWQLLAGSN